MVAGFLTFVTEKMTTFVQWVDGDVNADDVTIMHEVMKAAAESERSLMFFLIQKLDDHRCFCCSLKR